MNSRYTHAGMPFIRNSQTLRYAFEGMTYLASQPSDHFYLVEDIAKARNLPVNFLSKIFQKLAQENVIVSHRGPGGGYALFEPANKTTLAEVVIALEPHSPRRRQCLMGIKNCGGSRPCAMHGSVARADQILQRALRSTTIADLALAEDNYGHT